MLVLNDIGMMDACHAHDACSMGSATNTLSTKPAWLPLATGKSLTDSSSTSSFVFLEPMCGWPYGGRPTLTCSTLHVPWGKSLRFVLSSVHIKFRGIQVQKV